MQTKRLLTLPPLTMHYSFCRYMFSPGDKFTFLRGLPIPTCYGGASHHSYHRKIWNRKYAVRSAPSYRADQVGALPPQRGLYVETMASVSNADGMWLQLCNPNGLFGAGEAWCLASGTDGTSSSFEAAPLLSDDAFVINATSFRFAAVEGDGEAVARVSAVPATRGVNELPAEPQGS